jgi:sortase A
MAKAALAPEFPAGWRDFYQPGIHSYNLERKLHLARPARNRGLAWTRKIFLLLGLAGIAFYGYSVAEESVYQAYANWAFDQEIAGNTATFWDYVRSLAGLKSVSVARSTTPSESAPSETAPKGYRPSPGEMLGKVMISRLNMSAVVLEGVDDATLRRSAGHVPYTSLPGEVGNFSIAAHRDTLFRPLKDIRLGDEVQFETPQKKMTFRVVSTRIVEPKDVSVLTPQGDARLMTMVTCYPFNYVGSAPKRFIVTARLETSDLAQKRPISQ